MNLRKKLFTYLGIMIIVSLSLIFAFLYKSLLGSYADLDERDARSNMQDILYVITDELDTLKSYVLNYSAWDEMHALIGESDITEGNPFIQSNFSNSTYTANRFQFVLITNANGRVIYAHGFDLQQNKLLPPPADMLKLVQDKPEQLMHFDGPEDSKTGIVMVNEVPLLIASLPIVTNDFEGPIEGTIIAGRYLDENETERINKLTRSNVQFSKYADKPSHQETPTATTIEESAIWMADLSMNHVSVQAVVHDMFGEPVLWVKIEKTREVYMKGRQTMFVLAVVLLVLTLLLFAAIMAFIDKQVLSRLQKLVRNINAISSEQNLSLRVKETGTDEVGELEKEFNKMMVSLEASQEKVKEQSYMDPLTQLPNRILFFEQLAKALEYARSNGAYVAVLFIDLDNFKAINDTFGHENGDRVIQEIAKRLQHIAGNGQLVSRLGGDEFTVLLQDMAEPDIIKDMTSLIHEVLSSHVLLEGREVAVTASTGVSVFPFDGDDPETLVKNADVAMFQVKQEGKNNVYEYSTKMREENERTAMLESHLCTAVQNGELILLYQPKMDLRSFETVGVEALLRWKHPTLGMIPPDDFIPLAERTGMIVDIGKWVLHRACLDIKALQQKGFITLHAAVNLSVIQLEKDDIVQDIADILYVTELDPQYLELEITESVVMSSVEAVIEKLHALRELKVSVTIDDFGTGYSSLSYLKRFPLSSLKVDKCFVHELGTQRADKTIAKAIIDLGHNLGLRVVAEGVETKDQLAILIAQNCDEIQGYYISKPLTIDDLEQFLLRKSGNETREAMRRT